MNIDVGHALKEIRESLASHAIWAFLFVFCAVVLALPKPAAALLGIVHLREQYRPWIGVAAIGSGVGLLVSFGRAIVDVLRNLRVSAAQRELLKSLSPDEKAVLSRYILANKKTEYFDHTDGIARSLVAQGILYVPSQSFDITVGVAHIIQPWAWEYLRERPELLKVTEAEFEQLNQRARGGRRHV
jgi:hypothetical protein